MFLSNTPIKPTYPGKTPGEHRNAHAFAALRADGSVVTWGLSSHGGDSSAVTSQLNGSNVAEIFSTQWGFAALHADGSVVTWGGLSQSSAVTSQLNGNIDVVEIFSTVNAFAALRADGSVVTWGDSTYGGESSGVASQLNGSNDVVDIFSTSGAFAALRADGSVVTWGYGSSANISLVSTQLNGSIDVVKIFSTSGAFAALRADGSVVTWGDNDGGNSSAVAKQLDGSNDVIHVFSTSSAFAALRTDGSVVTWGYFNYGGNSSTVASQLNGSNDVVEIFSTYDAFAALRADGSVVTWGDSGAGGDSSALASQLNGSNDVVKIFSAGYAFAALRADGSVVTWGNSGTGGDSNAVASQLNGSNDVIEIFSTDSAFAALRADGSVVTWGHSGGGGDSSTVANQLNGSNDVVEIFSTDYAFAALHADGSVVTWGEAPAGGKSSSVTIPINGAINVVSMANPFADDEYAVGGSSPSDTTAPTVTTFTPADEASGVAVNSNIVLNFNEAIARGTGNIVLKTSAGTTVASYDAASSNISFAGSTLTLNPSADLAAGTAYTVEFATGSVKDLAGNNFAGTTSYNFTTASDTATPPPTLSKDAQFLVLQPSSPSIVGAGVGDDTYLISGSMIPAGKNITISDASGVNSIQLAPGLSITASQVTSSALKMTLNTGSTVTVLGANAFTYELGGNSSAGLNATDVSYASFVASALGTTLPTTGIATGGSLVVGGGSPATLLASGTAGNDFVMPQYASPSIVGAGAGDDTYLISSALLPAGTALTISDATGSNSIQLAPGLSITSSQVAASALKLTLNTGATVTILGANNFTYDVGGNTTAGIDQVDVSFTTLVQTTLGTTVPSTGTTNGGAVVIGSASPTGTPVQGNNTVNATAANDVFFFDAVTALLDAAGGNTQASISGFSTSADKLQINLPTANATIATLSQLNGQQGVVVQGDAVNNRTLINFGSDANGGEVVSLTLVGITNPAQVVVEVV